MCSGPRPQPRPVSHDVLRRREKMVGANVHVGSLYFMRYYNITCMCTYIYIYIYTRIYMVGSSIIHRIQKWIA